jgi:hypothetical protein
MPGSQDVLCGNAVARLTPFNGLFLLDFLASRPGISSQDLQVFEWREKGYVLISPVDKLRRTSPESYIYHIHPRLCYKIRNVRDQVESRISFPPSLRVD